jgi:LacI family transcriptional regulator
VATIQDVAQLAGVSKATVSHVINDTRPVTPATRQAVLDAIAKLNYRPSAIARSLNTNVTHTIGVLVADITNPFFSGLVRGVERQLSLQGYNLIVCNTDEDPEQEARYLDLLLAKRVDGLIIAPSGTAQPLFQQFSAYNTPLVFVDRHPDQPYGPVIEIDNFAAGYAATEHLIQWGHRRIAILSRNPTLSTANGRISGYRQALQDHGLAVDESLIQVTGITLDAAVADALRLLDRSQRPTAVVTTNHIMTLALLRALRERNLDCPTDISLVGFDDHPWASLFTPPLTVIRMSISDLSNAAVETLLQAIECRMQSQSHEMSSECTPDVLLPAELVVRASCAPLPSQTGKAPQRASLSM